MRQSTQNRIILVGAIVAILALMVGVGLGLLLSRGLKPPLQSSKAFTSLGVNTKEDYIILVAATYSRDHDLEKAQVQLARLEAPNINQWIASLIDRSLTGEWDETDTQSLMELAHGLGMNSPQVLAYMVTLTPAPTSTPSPTETPAPSDTPTLAPTLPASDTPAAVPPTVTPQPTSTPPPPPSDTPIPPTPTAAPTDTPRPQPSNTSRPQPTSTPQPTNPPAAKWSWTARLVGPGQEGQQCPDRTGLKLIRATVLDAAGNQIPGVWLYEQYSGLYQVSGHKGDDPFWGPGEAEFIGEAGQLCVASGEGGACESDLTRNLPCHDPPPFEDMWAAGYCDCCTPGITKEDCKALYDVGECLSISHYMWRVEFKRSW